MKKTIFLLAFTFTSIFAMFADTTYVVQKGDTLYSISRKYQITVAELRTANNFSEQDVLKAGQKLVIPEADIGTAAALSSTKSTSTTNITKSTTKDYVVAKGDTLYGIARANGMSVAELLSINNLDSSAVIKVGQKLKINSVKEEIIQKIEKENETETKKNQPIKKETQEITVTTIDVTEKVPDTRTYGNIVSADSNIKWPVKNPKVTAVKGKVSGVQLSAKENESVTCVHEGTVMYVGVYRGFGQVVFVQSKTGLIYAYTGLGSVKVKKGDYAVSGAELGTAGIDSISKNSQIQFMVFQNGQPVDPTKAPRN